MKVIIYVEGPSDKAALERLLRPLIEEKSRLGISITFVAAKSGDRKVYLLDTVPRTAVDILISTQYDHVIIMPDLYPKNKGFAHESFEELHDGVLRNFMRELDRKMSKSDPRIAERFHVFCFKHDLEVLVLAAAEQLRQRLNVSRLKRTWIDPVEDQNHDNPPKKVVKAIFEDCGQKYVETIDTPLILGNANYTDIADRCPQCFKPFVEFLESLEVPQSM